MSNIKISALTSATTPLAGTEVLPIVQSGSTVKVSVSNVLSAIVSAGTANGIQHLNATKQSTTASTFTYASGKLSNISSVASDANILFQNTASNGFGMRVDGGSSGKYSLTVRDYLGVELIKVDGNGALYLFKATTAAAPTYAKGAMYFDTTLNKLRIGGATAWETVTSA